MATNRSESLTGTLDLPFPEYADPPPEPLGLLRRWLAEAERLGVREPRALALATADPRGRTSVRSIVLHSLTDRGLLFTSHEGSRKGRELRANPWASALLYWREAGRQISVSGPVRRVPDALSDELWAGRPLFTHAMTVSTRQSEPLADPEELRERARAVALAGPQPRPAAYIGLELSAQTVEFWSDGSDRLHERLHYERTPPGRWTATRLQP
ncbi:phenazine biosynthesis FMN-dependent oxidase PhzG [Streptomyces sp. NPDC050418]|uniref:phenazine biosynthesis FMN-dependent oxidase PhzG n=1 Tax=Streptomyces sp. NPDC050418 TaxID=3365612 RepID=UPI0037BAC79E